MKKYIAFLVIFLMMSTVAKSMSYEQAREQALFLTDKMAYELNLTEEQYDAVYEINLDYLMSITTYDDLYGSYWTARNLDLSYILLDWQYRAFCAASYFYRPLYWAAGVWHFAIYSHYPRRDFFYFGRPNIFHSYRGGHAWRMNGGQSWYKAHPLSGGQRNGIGMRDRFDRGDFGSSNHSGSGNFSGNRANAQKNNSSTQSKGGSTSRGLSRPSGSSSQRTNRESSTRTTVGSSQRGTKGNLAGSRTQSQPKSTFSPKGSASSRGLGANSSTQSRPSSVSSSSGSSLSRGSNIGSSSRGSNMGASSRGSSSSVGRSSGSSSRSSGSVSRGSGSVSHSSGGHSGGSGHSSGGHGGGRR